MQELLRKIRQASGLSQQEMGKALGVSFATVNRWENGRAEPNRKAQDALYAFCKERQIPVSEITLQRIRDARERLAAEDRILLYHGSKSGIQGKIAPISRDRCDFGPGFYMGTDPMQPLTLICGFEKAKFYIVSVCLADLKVAEIPADIQWAMIVAFNRGKMEHIHGSGFYRNIQRQCTGSDILIGSIADDRMFFVLDNFFQGNITDMALTESLSALQLGKQYVAVTQRACDAVHIEQEIPISFLEKRFLEDASMVNREKGVSMANEICKNYRREGLFFDEILEKAGEEADIEQH